jgi:hypothetical protein
MFKPTAPPETDGTRTYITLRRMAGLSGIVLPLFCLAWSPFLAPPRLLPSISDYYTVGPRNVFVGILFAISAFLFAYQGDEEEDWWAAKIASLAALGVALCPVDGTKVVQGLHFGSAFVLFSAFAYFDLCLFTRTHRDGRPMTSEKRRRNRLYRACGWTIVVCVVAIGALKVTRLEAHLVRWAPVFFLEFAALGAFGVAWLVKGETLWADRPGEDAAPP